jgi:hypothetical protein
VVWSPKRLIEPARSLRGLPHWSKILRNQRGLLYNPGGSFHSFTFDNWGANPSATPGTSVTPGASNVEGSWTQVASSANIAQDVYAMFLRISDGASSAQIKDHLLDVGVDPAGGTSYSPIISNIVCGASAAITATGGGHRFFFPYVIRAGSSVAVRIQGSNATVGTVRVGVKFWGQQARPWNTPDGQYSETLGTITNSQGVAFTPGNAADGTWVSLGTTARFLWWWQIAYQVSNTTITAEYTYIDIAFGTSTNKHIIARKMHGGTTGETCGEPMGAGLLWVDGYCPVPAGTEIWIRGRCNNAPDTGYNGVAVAIGG